LSKYGTGDSHSTNQEMPYLLMECKAVIPCWQGPTTGSSSVTLVHNTTNILIPTFAL